MSSPIDVKATALWRRFVQWLNLGYVIMSLEKRLPFGINNWPLWSNEGVGGALTMLVLIPLGALIHAHLPLFPVAAVYPIYVALRHLYEAYVDINGYNAFDILWNVYGATLVELIRRTL